MPAMKLVYFEVAQDLLRDVKTSGNRPSERQRSRTVYCASSWHSQLSPGPKDENV